MLLVRDFKNTDHFFPAKRCCCSNGRALLEDDETFTFPPRVWRITQQQYSSIKVVGAKGKFLHKIETHVLFARKFGAHTVCEEGLQARELFIYFVCREIARRQDEGDGR